MTLGEGFGDGVGLTVGTPLSVDFTVVVGFGVGRCESDMDENRNKEQVRKTNFCDLYTALAPKEMDLSDLSGVNEYDAI